MKKFFTIFFIKDKKRLAILLFVSLLTTILEVFGLVLVIPYIDLMVNGDSVTKYLDSYPSIGYILNLSDNYKVSASFWFAVFYIVKNLLLIFLAFIGQNAMKDIKFNLGNEMVSYYFHRSYSQSLKSNSPTVIKAITYDLNLVVSGVLGKGLLLVSELLALVGIVGVLVWKNPIVIIVFFVIFSPVALIYLLLRKKLKLWGDILQNRQTILIRQLQEGVEGFKNLIVYGVQVYFIQKIQKNFYSQLYIKRNLDMFILAPRYFMEAIIITLMAIVVFFATKNNDILHNLPIMTFIAMASVRIMPMTNRILSAISVIRSSTPSIDVVFDTVHNKTLGIERGRRGLNKDKVEPFKKLTIEHLNFYYKDKENILKDINLTINLGDKIGIVGGSGAGKTTLVNLLLGLQVPSSGDIYFNNTSIYKDLSMWQKQIGYVSQDIFLLDATIYENIAYGIPVDEIDFDRIEEVVKMVKLKDWVGSFPEGVNSIVGERGSLVSGGQRQRIAIARAIYHNPKIIIFDEATSSLDQKTEIEILDDLYSIDKNLTFIIITHRAESIKRSDRVIVLDKGCIKERI
jgi:ATP-binding cassette, subfamily B, bacterial PglK